VTPGARVQAAIELLDQVIAAAAGDGAPADTLVQRYFKTRRYAGSKDRRAVRELLFRTIRLIAERPESGRAAMLALADKDPEVAALFDGVAHGPALRGEDEAAAATGIVPAWIERELTPLVGQDELPALLERAPLDLRVNVAKATRDVMAAHFVGSEPTRLSPWGLRLPPDVAVSADPAFADGRVEVQDEGSQLIALACRAAGSMNILDLCAGAGGKALALAAAAPGATLLATDNNRQRLAQLTPRAMRAGADIATRLLDGGREAEQLADLAAQADVVQRLGHMAAQSRGAVAADARAARPADRAPGLAARSRGALGQAWRRDCLCYLLDPRARRSGAGGSFLRAPFILARAG